MSTYEQKLGDGTDLGHADGPTRSQLWHQRATRPVPFSCRSGRRDTGAAVWTAKIDEEVTVTASGETGRKSIASNRRVRRDYAILKTYEAGIVLVGDEVKSLRAGHASLAGAFVQEHDGELMLHGLHIPEHAYGRHGTRVLDQPRRTRKLLAPQRDRQDHREVGQGRRCLAPLSLYFENGWARVEIALARGRRSFDKRRRSPSGTPTGKLPASSAIGYAGGDHAAAARVRCR